MSPPDEWIDTTTITNELLDEWELEAIHAPSYWPPKIVLALVRALQSTRAKLADACQERDDIHETLAMCVQERDYERAERQRLQDAQQQPNGDTTHEREEEADEAEAVHKK